MLSDKEIEYFKKSLEEMIERTEGNLNSTSKEMDTFIGNNTKDEADHASILRSQSIGNTIMDNHKKNIVAIKRSLKKIKDGHYGICDMCEESINIERLKVKMFADYCISCREIVEKQI